MTAPHGLLLCGAALAAWLLCCPARGNLVDDSLLFSIDWPGPSPTSRNLAPAEQHMDSLWVVSADKERYQCLLPTKPLTREEMSAASPYTGPSPLALLKPLFTRLFCSYRLEQYWTYELCHGKSIRQYHEESVANKVAVQEYYLGKYDAKMMERDEANYVVEKHPPRRIRLEGGVELPYLAVNMTGGTACELGGGAQRTTRVLYVCNHEARNEVLSVDELSTCEYQAVVLTPYLCAHPDYRLDSFPENRIQCVAHGGAPTRPRGFQVKEEEEEKAPLPEPPADKASQLVQDFLAGSHCLTGGAGWWRYEFCYGQRVSQFHEEKGKERTTILLGTWDRQRHIRWLQAHPERRPPTTTTKGATKGPKYLSHFYAAGDPCDATGKPRTVEVRLKCRQVKGHPDSVSLYLLEPQTCEYILGVESAIVCSLLDTADEYGLPTS